MRKIRSVAACALIAGLALTTPAGADDPDFVAIGGGWYDWNDDQDAVDLRIEYRSNYKIFGALKPWLGAEFTTDEAVYGVGGVLVDLYFGRRWVFTPSFGAG
ncbi:MAG: acyloxyacyl hydrolase, partial [Alphaproteobacteria bacterium]|nr:acyloxyacyl hydrolase [Alphaproteobacteria bacterium]